MLKELKINNSPGKPRPVYHQIAGHIKGEIDSGVISKGQRLPSVSDMIKEWSVGYPTIKNALNLLEEEGLIKCEKGRGKGPKVIVSPLKKQVSQFCFARWSLDSQIVDLEEGIRKYTSENNIELRVLDVVQESSNAIDVIVHESGNSDGFVIFPLFTEDYFNSIRLAVEKGLKIVFADRRLSDFKISSVSFDNFSGTFNAVRHLIERHNNPVYYIGYTNGPSSCEDRYNGWLSCMNEYFSHTDFREKYFYELPFDEAESFCMGQSGWEKLIFQTSACLLERADSFPVSIFCFNSDTARIFCQAAEQANLKVGTDVYVICFGDKPFCARMPVPLSSVRMDDTLLGYESAKLLHEELISPGLTIQETHRVLPVDLLLRKSSGVEKI